jgi:hypothetical protein
MPIQTKKIKRLRYIYIFKKKSFHVQLRVIHELLLIEKHLQEFVHHVDQQHIHYRQVELEFC